MLACATHSSRVWGQRSNCPRLVCGKLTDNLWALSLGHMVRVYSTEAVSHGGSPSHWESGQQSGMSPHRKTELCLLGYSEHRLLCQKPVCFG